MKRTSTRFAISVVIGHLFCSASGWSQQILRIGFEGPPAQPPNTSFSLSEYDELGMIFRPINPLAPGARIGRTGSGDPMLPDNGGAYLQAGAGDTLAFGLPYGLTFDLDSVDLAQYSTLFPDAVSVPFIGYLHSGDTVSTNLTVGSINFQTFSFGQEFSDLDRVELPAGSWSMDNVVVTVPEPSAAALAGAALGALGCARWACFLRRRSRRAGAGTHNARVGPPSRV